MVLPFEANRPPTAWRPTHSDTSLLSVTTKKNLGQFTVTLHSYRLFFTILSHQQHELIIHINFLTKFCNELSKRNYTVFIESAF